jgi:hypothetical protein
MLNFDWVSYARLIGGPLMSDHAAAAPNQERLRVARETVNDQSGTNPGPDRKNTRAENLLLRPGPARGGAVPRLHQPPSWLMTLATSVTIEQRVSPLISAVFGSATGVLGSAPMLWFRTSDMSRHTRQRHPPVTPTPNSTSFE